MIKFLMLIALLQIGFAQQSGRNKDQELSLMDTSRPQQYGTRTQRYGIGLNELSNGPQQYGSRSQIHGTGPQQQGTGPQQQGTGPQQNGAGSQQNGSGPQTSDKKSSQSLFVSPQDPYNNKRKNPHTKGFQEEPGFPRQNNRNFQEFPPRPQRPLRSKNCRHFCYINEIKRYACCDNAISKNSKNCPRPRFTCPLQNSSDGRPEVCTLDQHCNRGQKCCFDHCVNQKVCKPTASGSPRMAAISPVLEK